MICLKLDIDTRRGLDQGLPPLLSLLKDEGVAASVYFTMGPDESGKAVRRVFTRKGFLKKMLRTNAAKMYGWRTMLYGTLLPAPPVGEARPDLLKRTADEGHEIGLHAWSHVQWQDCLDSMSGAQIDLELDLAFDAWRKALGQGASPAGFAAPAWKVNDTALRCLFKRPFSYISVTRGAEPVILRAGEDAAPFPELPTTLPTLDEILAWDGMTLDKAFDFLAQAPVEGRLNVYTLHTEAEGLALFGFFRRLLRRWKGDGHTFLRLDAAAAGLNRMLPNVSSARNGTLAGRGGAVSASCGCGF